MSFDDLEQFLTTQAASEYLRVLGVKLAYHTLIKLRSVGGGPEFVRLGRSIYYTKPKLREFVRVNAKPMLATTVPAQARISAARAAA